MKKLVLTCLITLLCLCMFGFVACKADYKFDEFTPDLDSGSNATNDWTELDYPDEKMKVDGEVTTEEYGENYLSFTDVRGVNMKVYAYMGEEGVFFGFVSDDNNVYYKESDYGDDLSAKVYNNTSIEIQVAPAGTSSLNANTVQLRLGANGYTEQWIGLASADGYQYTRKYVPSMGRVKINGELNSSDCDGYSMEIYLPYTSMNLSERPETVVCAPSFNTKRNLNDPARSTWTMMLGCDLANPASWYVVDQNGMTARTSGFTENDDGSVVNTGVSNEFYFLDSVPQHSYYVSAEVKVNDFLNNDDYPKFGLVNKSEESLQTFHIDAAKKNGTNFGRVRAVQTTNTGTEWQWNTNSSTSLAGHWGSTYIDGYKNESKKLGMIYLDGDLYMLLDGKLVDSVKDYSDPETGAIPGFMCFNTAAVYSNIEYVTDEAKVREFAKDYIAKEVTIDGDFSDWEKLSNWDKINSSKKYQQDATYQQNTMTVYSFLGSDGLYIAYEVTHKTLCPVSKWDDGWFKNTNIEFFVGGSESNKQFALTTFGSGGYVDAVMTTGAQDKEKDCYTTKAEIFVPFANLEAYDGEKVSEVKVGFAFKSETGEDGQTMNGDSWWFFESQPDKHQFAVTADGIGKASTDSPKDDITAEYDLTLDGDLSDWKTEGLKTIGVKDTTAGSSKQATFYAVLAKDGLHLAVEAVHSSLIYGQSEWHRNTNFEFFIDNGNANQFYVYATGENEFKAAKDYMQIAYKTSENEGYHETVIEVFIPMENLQDGWIVNGAIRVGVAWKTAGDQLAGGEANGGGLDEYWVPKGSYPNNDDKPYVTQNGIYLKSEYNG